MLQSSLAGLRKGTWWTFSLSASAVVLLSDSMATAEGAAISMLSATGHESLSLGPGMRAPGAGKVSRHSCTRATKLFVTTR